MKRMLLFLLVFLFFSHCQNPSTTENQTDAFTSLDCDFYGGLSERDGIRCGYIEVPEDHDQLDGHQIRISYAIIKKRDTSANAYPILYFIGGPGGQGLRIVNAFLNHPLREKRDIILLDERGIGFSSGLPNVGPRLYTIFAEDHTVAEERALFRKEIKSFLDEHKEADFNLANYNVYQNAQDIGLLMEALPYEKYNLLGASYGSTLARVIMKYHPEKLRSVIMNAPNPPNGNFYGKIHGMLEESLQGIFDVCAADAVCRQNYPDLPADFRKAIASLKKDPLTVELARKPFIINAQDAIMIIRHCLYQDNALSTVPKLIVAINERDKETVGELSLAMKNIFDLVNLSMHFSSMAYDDFSSETLVAFEESIQAATMAEPGLGFFSSSVPMLETWHQGRASAEEKKLPISDIPTLILTTTYDPSTPARNGVIMKEQLSKAYLFEEKGFGHGVGGACAFQMMAAFLDNPDQQPDGSCLN
jgi:pimeloyl-ACP methyl ester carboxylesterase